MDGGCAAEVRRERGGGGGCCRARDRGREAESVHDNPVDPLEFSVTNNKLADKVADYPSGQAGDRA